MKWYWATAKYFDCKSHAIPEPLLSGVLDNLVQRGIKGFETKEVKQTLTFDLPGMAMVDRNVHNINITGLEIEIPSTDIAQILSKTEKLSPRNEFGREYYKLHGFHRCICFTDDLRDEFISALKRILPEAEAIAAAENEEFNRRVDNISKNANVVVSKRMVKKPIGDA